MTGSTIIPHPPVVWEHVRIVDIAFLLGLGAITELILRGIVLSCKRKPASLRKKEDNFFKLEYDTIKLRNKGPSAFVETSKSERQLLALDKELQKIYSNREIQRNQMEKWCLRYIRTIFQFAVFVAYYGIPVISYSGGGIEVGATTSSITTPMFFPLSVAEIGFRMISRLGLPSATEEGAAASIGALVVLWAGSSFVGQLMEGIEHLVLA